jgi:hypothetical protein
VKNVDLPVQNVHVKTTLRYDQLKLSFKDPGVYNPLIEAMEALYNTPFDKMWNFFDLEEVQSWKPQIEELREKKRF